MVRLAVLLLMSMWGLSAAAQQSDIYRVETRVANQSEAERITAAKATLGEVIVHITGDAAALQHPLVRQAINDAPNYLAKFSYVSDKSADAAAGVKLVLNYSPQAINSLLQQAQLLAVPGSAAQGVAMQVYDVRDFTAFKQVQAYLKTIAVIRRAELISVDKDAMLFSLTLDGDVSLLKSTLSGSNKLEVIENAGVAGSSPLSFRWLSY